MKLYYAYNRYEKWKGSGRSKQDVPRVNSKYVSYKGHYSRRKHNHKTKI